MNRRGFKAAVGVGLSVMLAASAMSGCSKAGNEEAVKTEAAKAEDTKSAGESSQAESGSEDGKGITLTVGFWGSSGEDKAVQAAAEGIKEAVPGVAEIKMEQYPGADDFYQKLPGQIAAGTAPDLIIATNEQHLKLIVDGLLLPLDQYGFDLSSYAQNAVEAWSYEDKQYAIPITSTAATFAVNDDLWKAAGLEEYPETWEEVYDAAKVLTKDGVTGLCLDIGNIFHPTQYMNSFGGGWKDGKAINSSENVAALEYIFKMFDEGLAVTAKDAGMTWDGEVFAGEKCAMSTGGPWYVGMMAESAPDVNYSFIPMPGGNGNSGVTLHSYGIAVVKDAENAELAAKAAYYLSREEAQIARAEITGDRPSIESALVSFREKNPALAVIDEYIGQATGFGYPADQEFKTDFSTALESHVYAGDTTTAQEILDTLAEKYGNQ